MRAHWLTVTDIRANLTRNALLMISALTPCSEEVDVFSSTTLKNEVYNLTKTSDY